MPGHQHSRLCQYQSSSRLFCLLVNFFIFFDLFINIFIEHGNVSPKEEAFLCLLQDRNIFTYELDKIMCNHCKEKRKTVDHLATRCEKMLYHDYTMRHNEVIRCLHLMICNRFGIKNVIKDSFCAGGNMQ